MAAPKKADDEKQEAIKAIHNQVKLGKTIWVGPPKPGFEKKYEKGDQLGILSTIYLDSSHLVCW